MLSVVAVGDFGDVGDRSSGILASFVAVLSTASTRSYSFFVVVADAIVGGGLGGGDFGRLADTRPATLPGRMPGGWRIEPNAGKLARLGTVSTAAWSVFADGRGSRMLCVREIEWRVAVAVAASTSLGRLALDMGAEIWTVRSWSLSSVVFGFGVTGALCSLLRNEAIRRMALSLAFFSLVCGPAAIVTAVGSGRRCA